MRSRAQNADWKVSGIIDVFFCEKCSSSSPEIRRRRYILPLHADYGVIDDNGCVETGLIEYCPSDNEPLRYSPSSLIESVLSTYAGPRVILALVAILYALGAIMNDNLPASSATSSRMVLATLVLSPFLFQIKPSLRGQVLVGGAFVSMGYISQSVALIDTSPALVSILGSATVLVCPFLQWLIDKKPMGMKDAPQTWVLVRRGGTGIVRLKYKYLLIGTIIKIGHRRCFVSSPSRGIWHECLSIRKDDEEGTRPGVANHSGPGISHGLLCNDMVFLGWVDDSAWMGGHGPAWSIHGCEHENGCIGSPMDRHTINIVEFLH